MYQDVLQLLAKGTASEYCDWELAQRLRESGISTRLEEIQHMRLAGRLLCVKARLELADDRPDLALATMRCNMALAKHTAETPTLISHLVGIAIAMRGARTLEQVIAHPRTPNLYWSLANLPQPFIDPRKAMEGERLGAYATFPGMLDVANNLDAGPLPPEQIEKMVKMYFLIEGDAGNGGDNPVQRLVLTQLIRGKHAVAKKALIEAGRPADKVEQWPHVQVAIMHALMEYDQLWDEYIKWQSIPYYKAAPSLEKYDKRVRASRQRGLNDPAIGLAPLLLPAAQKAGMSRFRLERQLVALRWIEAIRLYAAEHNGQLPANLGEIKGLELPVCPLTGQPFEYRRTGDSTAELNAPPMPRPSPWIQSLRYQLTLRR